MYLASITCPTCFETFQVPFPPQSEVPCEIDYDCEICCRPMLIAFDHENGEEIAFARSIHD